MAKVNFCNSDVTFNLNSAQETATWINNICQRENTSVIFLNVIFCSDEYLLDLNIRFLNHNWFTDIISFNHGSEFGLDGELYISIHRVKENAISYRQPFNRELKRVIAHGILHLMGYQDETESQKAIMRSKENSCLELW